MGACQPPFGASSRNEVMFEPESPSLLMAKLAGDVMAGSRSTIRACPELGTSGAGFRSLVGLP
jgi:hypothetical protein